MSMIIYTIFQSMIQKNNYFFELFNYHLIIILVRFILKIIQNNK